MTINKALIATAGFGTRFLPITKSIQKEMLPILNRPTIDYVVEDCIRAGITEIIFVVNEHNAQVRDYYTESLHIKKRLEASGKSKEYKNLENLHAQAKFTFITQEHGATYGTGVPVKLAQKHLDSEDAFLVFMGDDFIYPNDGSSEAQRMIEAFSANASLDGLVTCVEKPEDELYRYGVIKPRNQKYLDHFVEKPSPGKAPSNLVNISKYIFTPRIFEILQKQAIDESSNELLITDTVSELAGNGDVLVHIPRGKFYDSGSVATWLQANIEVAWQDPVLRKVIEKTLKNIGA